MKGALLEQNVVGIRSVDVEPKEIRVGEQVQVGVLQKHWSSDATE